MSHAPSLHLSDTLSYYKRPEVQEALCDHAPKKEIAARFGDQFGKRPDTLQYPNDVMEFAKQGTTSFHCSEELWSSPLQLRPGMSRKELDELRIGWDLVLDVDCKFLEYSKLAAAHIVSVLERFRISSLSVKFSGNHGFHIAIPFESFPQQINGVPTQLQFPEAAKRVALYVKNMILQPLGNEILKAEGGKFNNVAAKVNIPVDKLYFLNENKKAVLNVEPFLAIDTILLSSRHMYRMPYSMHEKSGLVSIPIDPRSIRSFDRESAKPQNVVVDRIFLDRSKAVEGEAQSLFTIAFDATFEVPEIEVETKKEYEELQEAIPEELFPPCVKKILQGMDEGRKRSVFILINFLASCGWDYDAIEARLKEWNQKNKEPLRDQYLLGQVRYAKQHKKKVLPPNCSNPAYYADLRVKCHESICNSCKNPVVYSKRKVSKKA